MQNFFGLNKTGSLDVETIEVMKTPRCGVPDVEDYSHNQGTHWNKNVITYSIGRYTRDLPRSTVDSLIESALDVWARASSLTFVRSQSRSADIMVEFVSYEHGDFYPFDGPKGTLAHAFGPGEGSGGDTHFDEDEQWTEGPNESMYWTVKGSLVKGKPKPLSNYGFPLWVQDIDATVHIGYLRRFYHLRPKSRAIRSTKSTSGMEEKMKTMQGFFGLPQTGRLDPKTLFEMKKDRCGVPDVDNFSFYPKRPKWRNNTITFRIDKYTPDLSKTEVERSILSALKLWSKAVQLRFIQVNDGQADIVLSFARKTHGDFFPFDGPRGVLAHAFEPGEGVGGDVHFDDDETWTAGQRNSGFDLLTVAAHEIGHSLGLSHSKDPTSLMFPNYKYYSGAHTTLPNDDVQGIQTLYGKPIRKPDLKPTPKKCDPNFSVDAVAVVGKEIVFFKNRYMWIRTAWTAYWNRLREGYSSIFLPTINSPVDAAYNIPAKGVAYIFTGHVYLFIGTKAFRYEFRQNRVLNIIPSNEYLSQFYGDSGVINSTSRRISANQPTKDHDLFKSSLETMQAFFGLEVTGRLDEKTLGVMKEPRCGRSDISRYGHFAGKPRWQKSLITYRITEYTRDLSQREVDSAIGQAFQIYSDVIPLDFKQILTGTADIMILFRGGYHGDFYPFDGPNGVLAHANSPGEGQGGDSHFDDDENWTLSQRGVNLFLVAAHEFGHALGLDHSRDRNALMFPTYRYVNTNGYKLPDDDRRGVQALYGSRTPDPPTAKPQPNPPPAPEPEEPEPTETPEPDPQPNPGDEQCSRDLMFDAATSIRGDLYFFKNGYYWRKSTTFQGIRLTKVSTRWPRINSVDAAYEVLNKDVVYLFEGTNYWGIRAYAKTIIPGYPKPITNLGIPSTVKKLDAAVHVVSTGKTLLFANNQYWRTYFFYSMGIDSMSMSHNYKAH
ncbi:uncharacterized protein FYW47_017431 [Aplochiton taeniatus]